MAARGDGSATCSVDNDDDAFWHTQRRHCSFGGPVDVKARFVGWLLLVVGAGPVEPSIAQHNAAFGENGTLQLCDSLGSGAIRQLPCDALSQGFRRPAPPRGLDQVPGSLGSDASVAIRKFADLC